MTVDAGRTGAEHASSTRMSLEEAYKVLGINKSAPLEEVLKVCSSSFLKCRFARRFAEQK